ncbi:MAG: hypothetical protein ACRD8W_19220 [Nitrososphaeraceae archaeon]
MTRLVDSEIRLCADCPNGVMHKLPGLSDIWMCETCSGVNYRLPEWWEMPAEQEDEDEQLYQVENSEE